MRLCRVSVEGNQAALHEYWELLAYRYSDVAKDNILVHHAYSSKKPTAQQIADYIMETGAIYARCEKRYMVIEEGELDDEFIENLPTEFDRIREA